MTERVLELSRPNEPVRGEYFGEVSITLSIAVAVTDIEEYSSKSVSSGAYRYIC